MDLTLITIFALAGVGLIIVAILGGGFKAKEISIPTLSNRVRVLSAIIGVGFLVVAIFLYLPSNDHSRDLPKATITFPAADTKISRNPKIGGTVRPAVPVRGSYWIVVRDEDGDHYPQAKIVPSRNGIWTHSLEFGPAWEDRPVWILVVFARNEQATDTLLGSIGSEGLSLLPDNVVGLSAVELRVAP